MPRNPSAGAWDSTCQPVGQSAGVGRRSVSLGQQWRSVGRRRAVGRRPWRGRWVGRGMSPNLCNKLRNMSRLGLEMPFKLFPSDYALLYNGYMVD